MGDTIATSLLDDSAEDLYENAPCGYLSTLADGVIVKVNQTLLSWTGYRRSDLLGHKRFYELLTAPGRIFHETHYAPLLEMQGFVHELALDLVCKDGVELPALINSVQKKDASGKTQYIRTTIFNATDRKRYERELLLARRKAEQEAKAKADLLSMISHDIRSPLHAIMAATELLKRSAASPAQETYIGLLRASSSNLLQLVNDVLDISKIEAGKLVLEPRSFELRQLVQRTVFGLSARAEEKGVELSLDADDRAPSLVIGDATKIGQVLTNLIANAIKFTERGAVRVLVLVDELRPDDVLLRFVVTDSGIGIDRERLSAIFDEYTQANDSIAAKYGGSGLGLAISRRLLELHGSTMTVESTVGVGSTFSFKLRLRRGDAPGAGLRRAPETRRS